MSYILDALKRAEQQRGAPARGAASLPRAIATDFEPRARWPWIAAAGGVSLAAIAALLVFWPAQEPAAPVATPAAPVAVSGPPVALPTPVVTPAPPIAVSAPPVTTPVPVAPPAPPAPAAVKAPLPAEVAPRRAEPTPSAPVRPGR